MQNEERNEKRSILRYVNAHGVQNDYNLDSLGGFMKRYVDWCIKEGNELIKQRRNNFNKIKNAHDEITHQERKVNEDSAIKNNRLKKLKNESKDIKKILQQEGNKNGFSQFLFSNKSFWALQVITMFLMGLWSLVLLLIRSNNIDVTNILGSTIEHFGSYSNGIPFADVFIIVLGGLFWTSAFCFTYLVIYYRYHLRKPNPNRKRYEYIAFALLISIEIWLTVYAIQQGYMLAVTNKKLAEVNISMLLFSGFPFVLAWIAIHFFYKIWLLNIRDDATEYTGEIYKKEKREKLQEIGNDINKLSSELSILETEYNTIENERKYLKHEIHAFCDSDYEQIDNLFHTTLDNTEAICTHWENKLDAKVILSGKNDHHDYKRIIKGIKEDSTKAIEEENKKLKKEHSVMINNAEKFLNKIKNGVRLNNNRQSSSSQLVRASIIALIVFGVAGCGGESKFFADNQIAAEFNNVIIVPDLSDRYLQDDHDLFLPVKYDLEVINNSYQHYVNNITQMYETGMNVPEVYGNFCIIPAPLPHDTRWNIMASGACWNLDDLPLRRRWEHLDEQRDSLTNYTLNLYNAGIEYTPTGVDYWQFFANQLPLYLKRSDSLLTWNNKIVLLTDGYLYFDRHLKNQRRSVGMKRDYLEESDMHLLRNSTDWEKTFKEKNMGFLPVGSDYSEMNISVLVVGLNPPKTFRGSAVEWQIIQKFWEDWFESMGIEEYRFVPLHSPATTKVIQDFYSH